MPDQPQPTPSEGAEAVHRASEAGHRSEAATAATDAAGQAVEDVDRLATIAEDMADEAHALGLTILAQMTADNKRLQTQNNRLFRAVVAVAVLAAILLGRELAVSAPQRANTEEAIQILKECTTPGDADDAHECFDDAQARQAVAIAQIVDANGNDVADVTEILDFLKRFEAEFLVP